MANALLLPELIARLAELNAARGAVRTRLARELSDVAQASLQAAGDEGAWEATRRRGAEAEFPFAGKTYADLAEELGVEVGPVNRAVSRHNKRLRDGR